MFAKTLVQLCKAIKAGSPYCERLIQSILTSLLSLDNATLLKIGKDLSNFMTLVFEKCPDATTQMQALIEKVGRLDNDLVVFCLRNKEEFLF